MKVIRKTFLTAAVLVFGITLCLLSSVLVLAACSEKVTLRFETYGGTYLESVEGKVGTAYTVPKEPQKEGYYFEGWYLSSDFSGTPQELPDSMPDESRTYYAKYARYPVLTLQPEGGSVAKTTHLIKPGVNITSYLSDYKPTKQGLHFGGWYVGDEPLDPGKDMSETDLTLTARYKADWEVKVYLQDADAPDKFEFSENLSMSGSDWEGTLLRPEIQSPEHFLLDESKKPKMSKTLSGGENLLEFYYLRKSVKLTYSVLSPEGETREMEEATRYGAHITLPKSPVKSNLEFFGWAGGESAPANYLPDEILTMGAEDKVLYATWGKKYANVRGDGELIVEEISSGDARQAILRCGEKTKRGTFFDETGKFEVDGKKGRLDGRGGIFLDDSGEYLGYKLRYNRAEESFGKLSLSFEDGCARYKSGETEYAGEYLYEFDESQNAYTGKYLFQSDALSFEFMLDEGAGSFLKEGEEKGSYSRYDGRELFPFEELFLDGFGGAEVKTDGRRISGTYRGGNTPTEWLFEGENSFRFMTCERIFEAGESKIGERAFLIHDENLEGTFEGSGTLTLDGYGILGEYLPASGERAVGAFTREGNFVTLYAESTLRFTLQGTRFSRTGAEAGEYDGHLGRLLLDGAGLGILEKASGQRAEGSYRMLSESEVEFTPVAGETLRLKLSEGGFELFDGALYGNFEGSYTAHLFLDGYGEGVYTSIDSMNSFPITVGYFDGDFLQIYSEHFDKPRYYQIGAGRELYLLQGPVVGKYALFEGGEERDGCLLLYDRNYGKFVTGSETLYGSYTYDAKKREVIFSFEEKKETFLLSESGGVPCCMHFTGSETFEGDGTLTLDGYGTASYESGEKITGSYILSENLVELYTENKIICFTVENKQIKEKIVYLRFFKESDELLLEEDGDRAIYRGERGRYEAGSFLVGGETRFSFKLFGQEFAFYDPTAEKVLTIAGGGKLSLDGCGYATLTRDDVTVTGIIKTEGDLLLFTAETLNTLTKTRAFRLCEGEIEPLGEEYGNYRDGSVGLFLDGRGNAVYRGICGVYEKSGNFGYEYVFESEDIRFRFRIFLKEDETCFETFNAELDAGKGSYETTLGTLVVSGYGVELVGADGSRTKWRVIAAGKGAFVAETPQGVRYYVSGATLAPVSERIEIK